MTDNESLMLQEATQIEAVYLRIYKAHEEMHYQYQEGMIDESVWGGFAYTIRAEASYQGFRDMWQGYRNTFSARFQKYMEELMAATPVDPDAYFVEKTCDTPAGKDYWRPY